MVCEKCEKKLSKVIVPDKWKEGASNTTEAGGRKINENKLLSKKKRWTPYGNTKCIICKQQVHQDAKYCHTCAYSKGVCAMCGKQVLDTKFYKQSNVQYEEDMNWDSLLDIMTDSVSKKVRTQ